MLGVYTGIALEIAWSLKIVKWLGINRVYKMYIKPSLSNHGLIANIKKGFNASGMAKLFTTIVGTVPLQCPVIYVCIYRIFTSHTLECRHSPGSWVVLQGS